MNTEEREREREREREKEFVILKSRKECNLIELTLACVSAQCRKVRERRAPKKTKKKFVRQRMSWG